jgi:hypothetical protein
LLNSILPGFIRFRYHLPTLFSEEPSYEILSGNTRREEWEILAIGVGIEYPDEKNLVEDVLGCQSEVFDFFKRVIKRDCDVIDEWIVQARREIDLSDRVDLYHKIEEAFFGREGTFPVMPLYSKYQYFGIREWLDISSFEFSLFHDFSNWTVDLDTKQEAPEE